MSDSASSIEELIENALGVKPIVFVSMISTTGNRYYVNVPRNIGEVVHGSTVIVVVIPIENYMKITPKAE